VTPILTPEEMAAVDAAAPEPVEVLIERAGAAVARAALGILGGTYGRRVLIVAGPGNNGADGRSAGRRLWRRGVRVEIIEPSELLPTSRRVDVDLVIDAAYGTGFRGSYDAPAVGEVPVLAVDIPSGIDGLTGVAGGRVLAAERTVTFAALKPGLLFDDGATCAGRVEVADIGLDVSGARAHLVTDADVVHRWPHRRRLEHKWSHAMWAIAGSPGMAGAAALVASSAARTAAGYVRLSSPGMETPHRAPLEAVGTPLARDEWDQEVLAGAERFGALVLGPGLGRHESVRRAVRAVATSCPIPVVIDGDGLAALAGATGLRLSDRVVLTPHDGEFEQLSGHRPGPDRLAAARALAAEWRATCLLKGPTTVVARPDGEVLVVTSGDARLATAGSGDVLSGMIGALLARGLEPHWAAALAAHLHGRAASRWPWPTGLVAGDLPSLIPGALAQLVVPAGS
jgi:NAD(P)H-hydrate epimerase